MHPDFLSKRDLEALSTTAALVRELHESGAVSDAERAALLDAAWNDAAQDREAARTRRQDTYFSSGHHHYPEEPTMDPRTIISVIERDHAVIAAQVEKLGEQAATLFPTRLGEGDTPTNVAAMVSNLARGHLQGAADTLAALAEVETNVRRQAPADHRSEATTTIDGEAVVITEEKQS